MKGRIALVTGASRGIGAAIAHRLQTQGATVLAPSRAEMDLGSDASMSAYLHHLRAPIDILVNNAGINVLGGCTEVSAADIASTLQVNLIASMRLISGVAPYMREQRYGRIVNVSSIWSFVSKERRLAYTAAKSAVNGMTRALAIELGPYGVTVNAIAPGYVNTDLTRQNNSPEELAEIEKAIPLGRLAETNEVAACVAFLCSEAASYVTGHVLTVDGGYLCR